MNGRYLTRRQWFAALTVIAAPKTATAAGGIHINAVLRPDNASAGDGYYALCGEKACDAKDAIGISVHPKGFFAKDFAAMAHGRVQFSLFRIT